MQDPGNKVTIVFIRKAKVIALETLGPINITGQNFLSDLSGKLTMSTVRKTTELPASYCNISLSLYNVPSTRWLIVVLYRRRI